MRNARARFAEIAARPDREIDVAEAALWIAAEAYPELDVPAYLSRLEALADGARASVGAAKSEIERIERLNASLFVAAGFRGSHDDYYDPRNSFLNDVLDRRRGIPITLSIVYVEVARRLGLDAVGVGFPGHFLAKVVGERELVIDAFAGTTVSQADCEARLRAMQGPGARFDASLLRAASSREILVRVLTNLKQIHLSRDAFEAALGCSERVLLLAPDAPLELRDRGLLYQKLDCYAAAVGDLERFLELVPEHESAEAVRQALGPLRRMAQSIH